MPPTPLHRHQLAWLMPDGWGVVLRREWDPVTRECLAHWAGHQLPLVVTRQSGPSSGTSGIAMGLPAPGQWGRRRLALSVSRAHVSYFDEFPTAQRVARLLPRGVRAEWHALCNALNACGAAPRVHGSYGWQYITGLDHVRASSDIDLWISVSHADQADAVVQLLQSFRCAQPKLDGELVFEGGHAVSWREWLAWRAGRTKALLVKHLDGSALVAHLADHTLCPAEVAA